MSWNVAVPKGATIKQAQDAINNTLNLPDGVGQHLADALDSLHERHGPDVLVDVTAHGHFFDGSQSSFEVTTVTIDVRKSGDMSHAVQESGTAADTHTHTHTPTDPAASANPSTSTDPAATDPSSTS